VFVGAAEHNHFGALKQLTDPDWFEIVYDDGHAAVYRVRGDGLKTQESPQ
jgi:hypothetical protein